jgi:hypothetical protein
VSKPEALGAWASADGAAEYSHGSGFDAARERYRAFRCGRFLHYLGSRETLRAWKALTAVEILRSRGSGARRNRPWRRHRKLCQQGEAAPIAHWFLHTRPYYSSVNDLVDGAFNEGRYGHAASTNRVVNMLGRIKNTLRFILGGGLAA